MAWSYLMGTAHIAEMHPFPVGLVMAPTMWEESCISTEDKEG